MSSNILISQTGGADPKVQRMLLIAMALFVFFPFCVALYDFRTFMILRELAVMEIIVWILFFLTARTLKLSAPNIRQYTLETKILWSVVITILLLGLIFVPQHPTRFPITLFLCISTVFMFSIFGRDQGVYGEVVLSGFTLGFGLYCAIFAVLCLTGLYSSPFLPETRGFFPGFNNIRHLAPLVGAAIIIAPFLFDFKNRNVTAVTPIYQFALLSVLWAVLLFSAPRGAVVSLLITFGILYVVCNSITKRVFALTLASLLTGSSLSLMLPAQGTSLGIFSIFFRHTGPVTLDQFSSSRLGIWKAGLTSSTDSPWLGHGIGNFGLSDKYREGGPRTAEAIINSAHNTVVEFIHAFGYIGATCLLLWIFIKWFKAAAYYHQNQNSIGVSAFAGLTFLLLYSLLNGLIYRYYPLMLVFILFAIVLAGMKKTEIRSAT